MLAWLLGGWLGDVFERTSRVWQVRHMGVRFAQENSAVVISNTMLKFHEDDRRAEYQHVWLAHPATFIDVEENTI